ncbi:hypothetical protein [Asticcacaulis tiandongensis]|uniref:hypothetical protein n=1 Tax=Asticcacaulis tiandongensis TaxID=2565365 RepID=UPI00112BB26D|nr:hypothetical protein [Asticcacaulis tiandongensis]
MGAGFTLLVHAGLMAYFLFPSEHYPPMDGLDGLDTGTLLGAEIAMDVSLVSPSPATTSYTSPQSTDSPFMKFMPLVERTPASSSVKPLWTGQPTLMSASEALGEDMFAPSAPASQGDPTGSTSEAQASQPPSDLWKAIEPCWKRLADKNTVPVTLKVTFSPLGNLAKPPEIEREPGAPLTDQLMRSENQAIMALSQCGPYLMAFGQANVRVRFPGGG